MKTPTFLRVATTVVCLMGTAAAQTAPPPTPFKVSGLVDGYYSFNANHPASRFNTLRNFEVKANQFSLNMTKFTIERDPDPVGFKLDLGFGRAWEVSTPRIQPARISSAIFPRPTFH